MLKNKHRHPRLHLELLPLLPPLTELPGASRPHLNHRRNALLPAVNRLPFSLVIQE